MKKPRHLALWIAVAVLGLAAVGGFVAADHRPPAPDVPYTRLDGSVGRIGGLKGQVVLVNFWATSCATCVKEMPQLVSTHEKFKPRGFETLAVAMSHDAPASVVHFTQTRRLPFTVVIDLSGEVARRFDDVKLTPTTLLIDNHGAIVKRIVGEPDFPALHARIEALLAER